jgi:hypothetical protein
MCRRNEFWGRVVEQLKSRVQSQGTANNPFFMATFEEVLNSRRHKYM